jgi:hypothetical protein
MKRIIAASISAPLLLATAVALSQTWTNDEQRQGLIEQRLHWGQKGQPQPNNGWSAYGSLRFDAGGTLRISLVQEPGELLATVADGNTQEALLEALIIRRTALLYRGKLAPGGCESDGIETLGLQAESVLFYLGQAFPQGPSAITEPTQREISGAPAELRFLQSIGRQRTAWNAKVSVIPSASGQSALTFEIQSDQAMFTGEWNPEAGSSAITDSDSLQTWRSCWFGEMDDRGQPTDKARAERLDSLKTLGELRALKEPLPAPAQ